MACIPGITESLRGGVRMTILLTGAAGQLGQALRQQVPVGVELIATSRSSESATGLLPLDLADAAACRAAVTAPAAAGPSACHPPPGARPCASSWRRWDELNLERDRPFPRC
jgi:hypothetical protein